MFFFQWIFLKLQRISLGSSLVFSLVGMGKQTWNLGDFFCRKITSWSSQFGSSKHMTSHDLNLPSLKKVKNPGPCSDLHLPLKEIGNIMIYIT